MVNLSTVSANLAAGLARAAELEGKKVDTLRFGLEVILGTLIELIVLFSLAWALGILFPVAVALAAAGLLRLLSGGAHCNGYGRCLTLGTVVYLGIGALGTGAAGFVKPIIIAGTAGLAVGLSALGVYKWAPADVPHRPIKTSGEIKLFRRLSFFYLALLLILLLFLTGRVENAIILACSGALLFQAFSLSPAGYRVIARADGLMVKLGGKGGAQGEIN